MSLSFRSSRFPYSTSNGVWRPIEDNLEVAAALTVTRSEKEGAMTEVAEQAVRLLDEVRVIRSLRQQNNKTRPENCPGEK
jgi:hypothetical protein